MGWDALAMRCDGMRCGGMRWDGMRWDEMRWDGYVCKKFHISLAGPRCDVPARKCKKDEMDFKKMACPLKIDENKKQYSCFIWMTPKF